MGYKEKHFPLEDSEVVEQVAVKAVLSLSLEYLKSQQNQAVSSWSHPIAGHTLGSGVV